MTERDHRNRRRSRTAAAIGSALVAVIIAVTAAVRVPAIERDIEQRSMLAIMVQSVAFGSFEIEVDGRDVFLSGSIAEEHADYL
ncbi:MAG: hypothetical protein GWN73_25105, partial [Actinobacteria bacterium]|nr:hypothetical protein [Actinomycetota bacterium]NIT97105.1 hypothetical protein [Actinomycetota bacterium]NIU68508.1 hypothetical protein [Actinomycetota bacterium]NIV57288.1 hypothetical protein [Actinomycetota bacterium]NIV88789.1 hypothetical protein [Actinomycetota bacterium]